MSIVERSEERRLYLRAKDQSVVYKIYQHNAYLSWLDFVDPGLEIATDTVANATNIFSLATKNSSLVAKVATRFLYDLELKE